MTTWDLGAPAAAEVPAPLVRLEGFAVPCVVVLITSAPWRRRSLNTCLAALAQQTYLPNRVLLVLDGAHEEHVRLPYAIASRVLMAQRREGLGPGARWAHPSLDDLDPTAIVITLDDDIAPARDFVERTVAHVLKRNAIVTWHGWRDDPQCGAMHTTPNHEVEVNVIGTGCSAFVWGRIRGMLNHALARVFLFTDRPMLGNDDDAFVALWIYAQGLRAIRPAGAPPLTELPTSRAADAGMERFAAFRHGQRLALALSADAPICPHLFPIPVAALPSFFETAARIVDSGAFRFERGRAALHRALAAPPHVEFSRFWPQLRDHLWALEPDDQIFELAPGPWSFWLEQYCAIRQLRLYRRPTTPQLDAALSARACVNIRAFSEGVDDDHRQVIIAHRFVTDDVLSAPNVVHLK